MSSPAPGAPTAAPGAGADAGLAARGSGPIPGGAAPPIPGGAAPAIPGGSVREAAALRVGPLRISPPVVLAPMAGVTNAPFRRLCHGFAAEGAGGRPGTAGPRRPGTSTPRGGAGTPAAERPPDVPGLFVSEMITARGLVERNDRTLRMARFAADEPVRSIQLYGTDPRVVGEAVRYLVGDEGADHVDLNFGCPVAKVTRQGGGAALPVRRALFGAIVRSAVAAAGDVPVTVKMRVGIDDGLHTFLDAGRTAEDAGAAAIALHGRTAAQHYSGRADWDRIAELKAAVGTVPVLGNGDIWEAADALRMMRHTGCDGVVVGRGCLGRPWLFRDLALAFAGRPVPPPSRLGEVVDVLRRHARLLAEWLTEPVAVRDIRKHIGWYLQGYPVGGAVRRRLATSPSIAALDAALAELDRYVEITPGTATQPRGKTSGPMRVVLPERWLERADDPAPVWTDEVDAVSGG